MKKTAITAICVSAALVAVAAVSAGVLVVKPALAINQNRNNLTVKSAEERSSGGDYIHFLSTGGSDAILIESDGKFAMIDAGEDSDNPRGFEDLELEGYEEKVVKDMGVEPDMV